MIRRNTTIEELVEILPESVSYLMEQGIRCIRCGEPIWDTLENAAREKEFTDEQIDVIVEELNSLLKKAE
jgi:methionine synthase II (cobalamin-independent)